MFTTSHSLTTSPENKVYLRLFASVPLILFASVPLTLFVSAPLILFAVFHWHTWTVAVFQWYICTSWCPTKTPAGHFSNRCEKMSRYASFFLTQNWQVVVTVHSLLLCNMLCNVSDHKYGRAGSAKSWGYLKSGLLAPRHRPNSRLKTLLNFAFIGHRTELNGPEQQRKRRLTREFLGHGQGLLSGTDVL